MSLRGSETNEAISECIDNSEIAALSRQGGIARNDKNGIATQSPLPRLPLEDCVTIIEMPISARGATGGRVTKL